MRHPTVVTGGSSGIGAALARAAAHAGRDVVVVARRPGPVGRHLAADLADPAGWDLLAAELESLAAGAEDIELFHAAATITPIGFAGEVDPAAYRTNVILNGAAPQLVGDAFLRAVGERRMPAVLVMISSGAARTPYPGWSSYCAGKAAMDHWTRTVGAETIERGGPKVVSIAPGVVDTAMQDEIRAKDESEFPVVERFRRLHADGELADPDSVARRIREALDGLESGSVVDLRKL